MKQPWSDLEIRALRAVYPNQPTWQIAKAFGRSVSSVNGAAFALGLRKCARYLATPASGRTMPGAERGGNTRFRKGHATWNKGAKLGREWGRRGRMAETQFKPGERRGVAAKNWCPVGTKRKDAEGYWRVKVREGRTGDKYYGFGNPDVWPLLHRYNWQQMHGSVPPNHVLAFRDGNRDNCGPANLELLSRREWIERNTVQRLPEELRLTIQLRGALNRRIRRISEEQNQRSA